MSEKNFSSGEGKEPKTSIRLPNAEESDELFGEEPIKPAPWEALRPVDPKPDEPKPPSRIGIFFRKALRWTTGLLFVFGLGVVTTWFVRVHPQNLEIADLDNRLQAAEIAVGELESHIATLMPLAEENEKLMGEITIIEMHVDVMKALVDVTSAERALLLEDPVTAKASLSGTDARLAILQEELEGDDQETLEGIRTRLTLVLEGLEEDPATALSDLGVLSSNLVALERSLFGN
jgi:hypothetical protein